ncbi:hypothetical protein HHI36_002146 [Cryptolaemus montrouzieri]|uniref:Uncharacterized protein n=1 Tax=Cryptolaemus montrouzieri TaxID=559131 RepID=A0ABD2PA09_9CUCU
MCFACFFTRFMKKSLTFCPKLIKERTFILETKSESVRTIYLPKLSMVSSISSLIYQAQLQKSIKMNIKQDSMIILITNNYSAYKTKLNHSISQNGSIHITNS